MHTDVCVAWLVLLHRVVRSGATYGVDFVLYSSSPGAGHAEYVVHVERRHGSSSGTERAHAIPLTTATALTRSSRAVAKEVLLCVISSHARDVEGDVVSACVPSAVDVDVVKMVRWSEGAPPG